MKNRYLNSKTLIMCNILFMQSSFIVYSSNVDVLNVTFAMDAPARINGKVLIRKVVLIGRTALNKILVVSQDLRPSVCTKCVSL